MREKKGAILTAVISILALAGVTFAFLSSASPYVTVQQAMETPGDNLHVVGDLQKGTVVTDIQAKVMRFDLKDETGDMLPIVYSGPPPANMGSATQVVAIGGMKGEEFHAHKLLVKCPTKYESEKKAS